MSSGHAIIYIYNVAHVSLVFPISKHSQCSHILCYELWHLISTGLIRRHVFYSPYSGNDQLLYHWPHQLLSAPSFDGLKVPHVMVQQKGKYSVKKWGGVVFCLTKNVLSGYLSWLPITLIKPILSDIPYVRLNMSTNNIR